MLVVDPLVGFVEIVESQVVVDGFGGQHARKELGQRLHPVDRAVPADADQALDSQFFETLPDFFERLVLVRIDVVA